jgi:uncharacterized membrane protein
MLSTFGCFWAAEGAGVRWPGHELSLLAVLGFFAAAALAFVKALQRQRRLEPV